MSPVFSLLIAAGLLQAGNAPKGDSINQEMKKLEGKWTVVSLVMGGKKVPDNNGPATILIKGNQITIMEKLMTFKIDPTKKPKNLDLRIGRGEESVDWKCIYSLEGDQLKICMPLARKKGDKSPGNFGLNIRPESFDTSGIPLMLISARREGKK
jgi:uncharacterized protein (TIGR03067 family)